MFRKPLQFLLFLAACLLYMPKSFAHPMGNFSVNHYSKISLENDGVKVTYIIDLAEIPTYQELQQGNITATVADPAVTRFVASRGAEFGRGLSLQLDGKPVALRLLSSQVIFPPGAGGLPTMKMGFVFRAAYPPVGDHSLASLQYADNNFPGHAGWKEIIAVAPTASLIRSSSVPQADRSAELTNYPTDLLNSPPQDLSAAIEFRYPGKETAGPSTALRFGRDDKSVVSREIVPTTELSSRPKRSAVEGPAVSKRVLKPAPGVSASTQAPAEPLRLQANQQATPRSAFTELITTRSMSLWFLITAGFIALGLGALHALEPGHGKTIVAAYLVGSRGTARHALLLGLIVTASHTAGVFALGAITLYASRYIVPEQLYPWLGVFSGLTIAGLGGYMFLRRWSGLDLDHSHTSGQLHSHWFSSAKQIEAAPQPVEACEVSVALSTLRPGNHRRHHPLPRSAGGLAQRLRPAPHRLRLLSDYCLQSRPGSGADWFRHAHGVRATVYGQPAGGWSYHYPLAARCLRCIHDHSWRGHRAARLLHHRHRLAQPEQGKARPLPFCWRFGFVAGYAPLHRS